MKFIHTTIIEQLPNGETLIHQSSRKVGEGQPSTQMRETMAAWYDAFFGFFKAARPAASLEVTAVPGYVSRKEQGQGVSLAPSCDCRGNYRCEEHFDFN